MATIPCLYIKDAYAGGMMPLAHNGKIYARWADCRGYGKSTRYRGPVALACGRCRMLNDEEHMCEAWRIPRAVAKEFADWFHASYQGRIFAIHELVDVVATDRIDGRRYDELADASWIAGHDGLFWVFRRPGPTWSPTILRPQDAPIVKDVCAGCLAGEHWKKGRGGKPRVGVTEGNYHIGLFDVRLR